MGGCSQSHRDATIARSAAHNPSTSTIESEAALNPSLVEKKVFLWGDVGLSVFVCCPGGPELLAVSQTDPGNDRDFESRKNI